VNGGKGLTASMGHGTVGATLVILEMADALDDTSSNSTALKLLH